MTSLLYGPLTLMASIFTTLLVFNMIFARLLLNEPLTKVRATAAHYMTYINPTQLIYTLIPPSQSKIAGAVTILIGVCLCVVSTPTGIPVDFSPRDVLRLLVRPEGAIYVATLVLVVLASVVAIVRFESTYPGRSGENEPAAVVTDSGVSESKDQEAAEEDPMCTKESSAASKQVLERKAYRQPPRSLDNLMGVVYPASLGLDEAVCHLTMKAVVSMLANCNGDCNHWLIYVFGVVWISASIATLWWLKKVFGRYQTTLALPIEYGTVNIGSMCSGLIFYAEAKYLATWQLSLTLVGLAVILSGIGVGRVGVQSSGDGKRVEGIEMKALELEPPSNSAS